MRTEAEMKDKMPGSDERCEGRCFPHAGEVRAVHVFREPNDGGIKNDWGTFLYCDTAVDEDRRRGFTVVEASQ